MVTLIGKQPQEHIYPTEFILKELNNCVVKKEPFSIIRLGDAGLGIIYSFNCKGIVDRGKWKGGKGRKMSNNILGQLTVPPFRRERIVKAVINACDNANFVDCYEAFFFLNTMKGVGILGEKWKDIHECCGITNTKYCSSFVHYFSITDGEYNLFNIMKNRKIFCITSTEKKTLERLKIKSGADVIDSYQIPRRGRKGGHYRLHFKRIMRLIKRNAKDYDLFLIGAGFLGKVYCGKIKQLGGRAFDAGRLFDFWGNGRIIDSRPKRFIVYNQEKMLCDRIKTSTTGKGVW
jgi:hypothetical protein